MNHIVHNTIVNFIWGIADDVLRDHYVRGKYRDVILPMVVIRRLDAILEPTKEAVMEKKKFLDDHNISDQYIALCSESKQAFFNSSPFTLKDLKSCTKHQQLKKDFENYLNGFSKNVQEILDKFAFRNQIPKLINSELLGFLIEKYLDPSINLSPNPTYHDDGTIKLPGLDNHAMGTVFEELIRRFNEENNEEAGEHFTPRDVVKLMSNIIFMPIADKIEDNTYLVYDGACGTGGMLTIAEQALKNLAEAQNKNVKVHLYGQEVNEETYAIAKADLLIKGEGDEAEHIAFDSTISKDAFPTLDFDFMLSNPPYGKSWKLDQRKLGGKGSITDPRFIIKHGGDPEYSLITRSSDGQMIFLANKLSKMKNNTPLGSRIAEVHNGSSLFTGDAGQGESNIRRWILENDWLEAIVALPENMFYNTGIATYIWVLSNRKSEHRRGKVQLIDTTGFSQPLRKNLGKKNCEFSEEQINEITDIFISFKESPHSKIFSNEEFGYWKITVERPLRLQVDCAPGNMHLFSKECKKAKEEAFASMLEEIVKKCGGSLPTDDFNGFIDIIGSEMDKQGQKLTTKRLNLIKKNLTRIDEKAKPVIKKIQEAKGRKSKVQPDPLHGLYEMEREGRKVIVEYEPDTNLRDYEQIPLLETGGIEEFFRREVLPYVPDAWIDSTKTKIGYEISFTRYFYKPVPMRPLEEIRADILALEQETEGLLEEIIGKEQ